MASVRLIIPVKPLDAGKSRLGGVLGPEERRTLNLRFLDHVLSVASEFPGVDRTTVVSADEEILSEARDRGIGALREAEPGGLNKALMQAIAEIDPDGDQDVLIVPSDLPSVTADDLSALCSPPVAVAPDRHGIGTNGLFMAAPYRIAPRFGPRSLARHLADARRLGIVPVIVERPGLAFDVDTADDHDRLTDRGGLR